MLRSVPIKDSFFGEEMVDGFKKVKNFNENSLVINSIYTRSDKMDSKKSKYMEFQPPNNVIKSKGNLLQTVDQLKNSNRLSFPHKTAESPFSYCAIDKDEFPSLESELNSAIENFPYISPIIPAKKEETCTFKNLETLAEEGLNILSFKTDKSTIGLNLFSDISILFNQFKRKVFDIYISGCDVEIVCDLISKLVIDGEPTIYGIDRNITKCHLGDYNVPMDYLVVMKNKQENLDVDKFSPEILLYIYFAYNKDIIQIGAAYYLHKLGYRYLTTKKFWLKLTEKQLDLFELPGEKSIADRFLYFNVFKWEFEEIELTIDNKLLEVLSTYVNILRDANIMKGDKIVFDPVSITKMTQRRNLKEI